MMKETLSSTWYQKRVRLFKKLIKMNTFKVDISVSIFEYLFQKIMILVNKNTVSMALIDVKPIIENVFYFMSREYV